MHRWFMNLFSMMNVSRQNYISHFDIQSCSSSSSLLLYFVCLLYRLYRAEKDFHDLVPEQAHKERLQELHLLDDMDVSECYHSLLAMMRAVFHENEIERPSAYELLHWDVMLKGRDVRILDM